MHFFNISNNSDVNSEQSIPVKKSKIHVYSSEELKVAEFEASFCAGRGGGGQWKRTVKFRKFQRCT